MLNCGRVGIDAEAEVRRAAERDHLAVRPDEVRDAADAADGVRDVGQVAHLLRAATRSNGGAVVLDWSESSKADLPVTVASVPR